MDVVINAADGHDLHFVLRNAANIFPKTLANIL